MVELYSSCSSGFAQKMGDPTMGKRKFRKKPRFVFLGVSFFASFLPWDVNINKIIIVVWEDVARIFSKHRSSQHNPTIASECFLCVLVCIFVRDC